MTPKAYMEATVIVLCVIIRAMLLASRHSLIIQNFLTSQFRENGQKHHKTLQKVLPHKINKNTQRKLVLLDSYICRYDFTYT